MAFTWIVVPTPTTATPKEAAGDEVPRWASRQDKWNASLPPRTVGRKVTDGQLRMLSTFPFQPRTGQRSKAGQAFVQCFPPAMKSFQGLQIKVGDVLDGELVAFDDEGRLSFNALQNAASETHVIFFAFDVLVSQGKDVKALPLRERKDLLKSILNSADPVQLAAHFGSPLSRFLEGVKQVGGEGVVAKRLDSRYEPGRRSGSWSKMRINIGQEFVIGGFTPGSNDIDALVVGYYEGRKLICSNSRTARLRTIAINCSALWKAMSAFLPK